jgi:hypothetical protein
MESVVYVGVEMNFIPSPSMDFAAGGMILPSVRSWKARFSIAGDLLGKRIEAQTDAAFWKGYLWGFGKL